jgi:hypothetical protein
MKNLHFFFKLFEGVILGAIPEERQLFLCITDTCLPARGKQRSILVLFSAKYRFCDLSFCRTWRYAWKLAAQLAVVSAGKIRCQDNSLFGFGNSSSRLHTRRRRSGRNGHCDFAEIEGSAGAAHCWCGRCNCWSRSRLSEVVRWRSEGVIWSKELCTWQWGAEEPDADLHAHHQSVIQKVTTNGVWLILKGLDTWDFMYRSPTWQLNLLRVQLGHSWTKQSWLRKWKE